MAPRSAAGGRTGGRLTLVRAIGRGVSQFQEASYAFDDVAAEVLALSRSDLPCMTLLLFKGPASAGELAAGLHAPVGVVSTTLERLQLAGYARLQPGSARVEITEHARKWIERIWAPLQQEGQRLLDRYPSRDLTLLSTFLRQACEIQESRTQKLRSWLSLPSSSPARRSHLRGGLSPAALRRVQLFVEANLARPIHLQDLAARAALSPYHFARAFKTTVGMTPRAFVEHRRIEHAKRLLGETAQPVAAIAVETGFGTQSRLTTIFRRRTGFTPAAYRRGRA